MNDTGEHVSEHLVNDPLQTKIAVILSGVAAVVFSLMLIMLFR